MSSYWLKVFLFKLSKKCKAHANSHQSSLDFWLTADKSSINLIRVIDLAAEKSFVKWPDRIEALKSFFFLKDQKKTELWRITWKEDKFTRSTKSIFLKQLSTLIWFCKSTPSEGKSIKIFDCNFLAKLC